MRYEGRGGVRCALVRRRESCDCGDDRDRQRQQSGLYGGDRWRFDGRWARDDRVMREEKRDVLQCRGDQAFMPGA